VYQQELRQCAAGTLVVVRGQHLAGGRQKAGGGIDPQCLRTPLGNLTAHRRILKRHSAAMPQ
jgi:hypothetical protein